MLTRRIFAVLPLLAVGACIPDRHSVPQDSIRQFRITTVKVLGVEKIYSWPSQEKLVTGQGKLSEEEQKELTGRAAGSFPAVREQMEKTMQAQFAAQVNNQLGAYLSGSKPATLVITVKQFDIPSVARKVIVGGNAIRQFDIELVDSASGTPVVRYQGVFNQKLQLNGLASLAEAAIQGDRNDPASEMIRSEIENYREWLVGSQR
jgi:hypothetical protein